MTRAEQEAAARVARLLDEARECYRRGENKVPRPDTALDRIVSARDVLARTLGQPR